jgi:hypothetical protein
MYLSLSVMNPALPQLPLLLWSAGMATGGLGEWSEKVNTGSADTTVVSAASVGIPPRSGSYVMMQAVTGAVGGTRMQRYPEVAFLARAGTPFYWSWWDYYPSPISYGIYDMFSLWQIASVDANGVPSPIWTLNLHGSGMTLDLIWSPNNMAPAGPHLGETGKLFYYGSIPVPVGKWNFFEVYIAPSADFTGALKLWLNGAVLFDLTGIKTRFPDSPANANLSMYVTHNGYGSWLTPTPAIHYVGDVTISLGRMPYAP